MTSGHAEIAIHKATEDDLDAVKSLADLHRRELGFVRRPALLEAIRRSELTIARDSSHLVGFVHYRHRRDTQTTLYDIAVKPEYRRTGIAKALVQALISEARSLDKHFIVLKCPSELPANAFYARLGFERWAEEPGRRRKLTVWRLPVSGSDYNA